MRPRTVALLALAFFGLSVAGCAPAATEAPAPGAERIAVSAPPSPSGGGGDRYMRGNPAAPVTIIEFADYECPYCGMDQPVLKQLLERYDGRVRLVFRNRPIGHPGSFVFAQAARCAGEQGRFWEMHDYILGHVGQLDPSHLKTYADNLGMDGEALESCVRSGRYGAAIEADARSADQLGAPPGTPMFFVNGKMLEGAQTYEQLATAVDEALTRVNSGQSAAANR